MPNWAKNAFWIFLFLVLLAKWRGIGEWISGVGHGMGELLRGHSHDPAESFPQLVALGIIAVTLVALAAIYWGHRGEKKP